MAENDNSFGRQLSDELGDVEVELSRIHDLASSVGETLARGFRGAILEGKSFKSILGDIAKSFTDIALKAALKPVGLLASGLIESLFKTFDFSGGATGFAKGGVISSPTYFPLGNGTGLAGEAGPEAILPLKRGSDGRLGVASSGSAPISISMNIQASDARSFVGAEAELSAMLLRAVKRGTRAS